MAIRRYTAPRHDTGDEPMKATHGKAAHGGKAVYGASVGILLLESRFPRIPGDGGNAETWPFPVLYRVVAGATPDKVVRAAAAGAVEDFVAAARELVALGADGITTNCGFLVLHQDRLARACGVPVAVSSLMQVPWVQVLLPPGRRVGVLTVDASSLTPRHLECAGAPGLRLLQLPVLVPGRAPAENVRRLARAGDLRSRRGGA